MNSNDTMTLEIKIDCLKISTQDIDYLICLLNTLKNRPIMPLNNVTSTAEILRQQKPAERREGDLSG